MKPSRKQGYQRYIVACLITLTALFLASSNPADSAPRSAAQTTKEKVILLGFDGVDYKIASRFMEEGHLPNLKALQDAGTFKPLNTVNPAQSPVAWASIVTGTNPGKTNIGGFIRRSFSETSVSPQLATIEERYGTKDHTMSYAKLSWINQESKGKWIGIFALGFFVVGLFIFKVLLSLGFAVSLVGGIILGGAAAFFGFTYFDELPDQVPFPYNLQQGNNFWNILAENQVRTVGLYAPGAYPVVAPAEADLLGGLGNPDVNGGTGTWYIYSSEGLVFFDMDTGTAGKVIRMNEEGDGRIKGKLYGPKNFFRMEKFKDQIEVLKQSKHDPKLTPEEKGKVGEELADEENAYRAWKDDDDQRKATLEFWLTPDYDKKELVFNLDGQSQTIKEGDWSNWFTVNFELSRFLKVPALARVRMIKCSDGEVRFFVPAIDISPQSTPPYLRISSPADYASTLAKEIGPFETVGWACITHGLKDEEISEEIFMEDSAFTMGLRRKLMQSQLGRKDWDMFMEVFYTTDRVQHMMYRLFDAEHPMFKAALAEKTVGFFDRTIKLKDSILEIYKEMDTTVGMVMEQINRGDFGKDPTLMIVSDHGFAPFYYGVGVNNLLIEHGFLTLPASTDGEPQTVQNMFDNRKDGFLQFVDWPASKAYSLGLGKIFINLKGREPKGMVAPEDYDTVRNEIIKALEAYVDPATGEKVVKKVYKREDIFSGDFWKEGDVDFTFYDIEGNPIHETRYTEGFADLYIGFYPKYRVSWQTSLGGLEDTCIVPNEQKWSGDHVSVDPDEVRGIFFCNKKTDRENIPGLEDIVPTLLSLFDIPAPENIDGQAIQMKM